MKGVYRHRGKRLLDVLISAAALLIAAPVISSVVVLVRILVGAPGLLRQQRPGLLGQPFTLLKIRTMTDARDERGNLLPDAYRLTGVGRFLRSTSIDELPELWNVLRGDMSLVGPRPLLIEYLERYTPEQARRHEVRPGITGLAQINGRNALSWEKKFRLDVEYVDRCSFALDTKIVALTVWQVLARNNINQPGHATAEEFTGTSVQ